ncbi:MAG: DUF4423 domain-containing protein [Pseudobdellovibrionaceae bacterium]
MAEAAGCQPSYLSQVLSGKVQLIPDHGWGIVQFLNLSELEGDYFMALIDHARTLSPKWRAKVESRMASLQKQAQNIGKRLEKKQGLLDEHRELYFSSWLWAALHRILDIPNYQTVPAIASRLKVAEDKVLSYLEGLEKMGLAKRESGLWKLGESSIHLSKTSPLLPLHLHHWRTQAVLKAQDLGGSNGVHFTGVYTLSVEAYEHLHELLLKVIEDFHKVATPTASEEIVTFNCDLFKV